MKMKTVTLLTCLLPLAFGPAAVAQVSAPLPGDGTSSGGGGFMFYNTSGAHLRSVAAETAARLSGLTESQFRSIVSRYAPNAPANARRVVIEAVRGVRSDFTHGERLRTNPEGVLEPLLFDYGIDGSGRPFITALRAYFEVYNKATLTRREQDQVRTLLIHEASHLIGIGVEDDRDSRRFAHEVSALFGIGRDLRGVSATCGAVGTLSVRTSDCAARGRNLPTGWRLAYEGPWAVLASDRGPEALAGAELKIYQVSANQFVARAGTVPARASTASINARCASVASASGLAEVRSWRPATAAEIRSLTAEETASKELVELSNFETSFVYSDCASLGGGNIYCPEAGSVSRDRGQEPSAVICVGQR